MRKMFSQKQIEELAKEQAQSEISKEIPDYENVQLEEIAITEADQEIEIVLKENTFYKVSNPDEYDFSLKSSQILGIEGTGVLGTLIGGLAGIDTTPESRYLDITGSDSNEQYFFFSKGILYLFNANI